eukprot:2685209-Pyramimonas_sp.AAC.1
MRKSLNRPCKDCRAASEVKKDSARPLKAMGKVLPAPEKSFHHPTRCLKDCSRQHTGELDEEQLRDTSVDAVLLPTAVEKRVIILSLRPARGGISSLTNSIVANTKPSDITPAPDVEVENNRNSQNIGLLSEAVLCLREPMEVASANLGVKDHRHIYVPTKAIDACCQLTHLTTGAECHEHSEAVEMQLQDDLLPNALSIEEAFLKSLADTKSASKHSQSGGEKPSTGGLHEGDLAGDEPLAPAVQVSRARHGHCRIDR